MSSGWKPGESLNVSLDQEIKNAINLQNPSARVWKLAGEEIIHWTCRMNTYH